MGTNNSKSYTNSYGTVHSKATGAYSENSAEYKSNCKAFYAYMTRKLGYTHNAACAILGNIYAESGMNPWRWQGDAAPSKSQATFPGIGYGLVQWTPAQKYVKNTAAKKYQTFGPNYSDEDGKGSDWYAQMYFMNKINTQAVGGYGPQYAINTSYNYQITWTEFKTGNYSLEYLAAAWLHNFERPADQSTIVEDLRYSYALTAQAAVADEPVNEYTWPLPGYSTITTRFGELDPWGVQHRGTDVAAPEGTPIQVCKGGTVVRSEYNDSWGNFVQVDHGNGMKTLYAHMITRAAEVGDTVVQGQVIGYVGSTGQSTGNHLHIEFELNGTLVDPLLYINPGDIPGPEPGPSGNIPIGGIISTLRFRKVIQ